MEFFSLTIWFLHLLFVNLEKQNREIMAKDKYPTISGVYHSKYDVTGTRKDGTPYTIPHIILEVDGSYTDQNGKWIDKKYLMDFSIGNNVLKTLSSYSVMDLVEITFAMKGREFKKKNGEMGYDNAMIVINMKHADIDYIHDQPKKLKADDVPTPKATAPVKDTETIEDMDLPF